MMSVYMILIFFSCVTEVSIQDDKLKKCCLVQKCPKCSVFSIKKRLQFQEALDF